MEMETTFQPFNNSSADLFMPGVWWDYFSEAYEVKIRNEDSLCLYTANSAEQESFPGQDHKLEDLTYLLMLHGGGYSGLTWAPMIVELSKLIEAEYGCLDLRGHGESECKDETDLSLETLTQDILDAITWMQTGPINLGNRKLVIVGHSLGGALAINVGLSLNINKDVNLAGVIVLDVVEGSAMQALSSMHSYLRGRPKEFPNMSNAILYCLRAGQTKNVQAARISVTGQLHLKNHTEFLPPHEVQKSDNSDNLTRQPTPWIELKLDGFENKIRVLTRNPIVSPYGRTNVVWRIDLSKTEPYWRGWFQGLSKKFLCVKSPKLLMLAGVDRLDTTLTVGQMQGSFQMEIFHQVGHCIHEDAPDKVALSVAKFLHRHRYVKSKFDFPPTLPGC